MSKLQVEIKHTFEVQIWTQRAKIGPEIRVFAILSSLFHYCSFKLHGMIAWINVYVLVEVKRMKKKKKNTGGPDLAKRVKIGPEIRFFPIFSSLLYQFSLKLHRIIAWIDVYLLV